LIGKNREEAVEAEERVFSLETMWERSRDCWACCFIGNEVRGGGGGGGGVCRFQRNDMGVATEVEGWVVSVEMRWERQ
jgi:hypothetical protein